MYSRWLRNSFIYLLILVAVIAIVFAFFSGGEDHKNVAFGTVVTDAKAGLVQKVEINGKSLTVTYYEKGPNGKPIVQSSKVGSTTQVDKIFLDEKVPLKSAGQAAEKMTVRQY